MKKTEKRILFFVVVFVITFLIVMLLYSAFFSDLPYSPLQDEIEIANNARCQDSDGGIFFGRFGEVSYFRNFFFFRIQSQTTDACNGDELTEYYCADSGSLAEGRILCSRGCVDGACIQNLFSDGAE